MDFQKVDETYLGILFLHRRVTKGTFRFMVEKVRNKLSNWDAKQLSFAGRVKLAQSVLLSISNYFMQTMKLPKGICEEIEGVVRQFILGSSNGSKKITLVS